MHRLIDMKDFIMQHNETNYVVLGADDSAAGYL